MYLTAPNLPNQNSAQVSGQIKEKKESVVEEIDSNEIKREK